MPPLDLANPTDHIAQNYRHQIRQTIDAYSVPYLVVGEALQNALDAVAEGGPGVAPQVQVEIDLDEHSVTVSDHGIGFPPDARLLVLGGTTKTSKPRKSQAGLVGVGIKVTLFSSEYFEIRARTDERKWRMEVQSACHFDNSPPPDLRIDDGFADDPEPLEARGTTVYYRFPSAGGRSAVTQFMQQVLAKSCEPGHEPTAGFAKTVMTSKVRNKAAFLVECYLRRFTYAGDTLEPLGGRDCFSDMRVLLRVKCSDPVSQLGEHWASLFGADEVQEVEFSPSYLNVQDTVTLTTVKRPPVFTDRLGRGGTNMTITALGFNHTQYIEPSDYERLVTNKKGELPSRIEVYREGLFPKLNCIAITVGRIPPFYEYLPGGSRRVLAANGVVTEHHIDITSGRNQQYVRCVDLVVDVDAELNYGKSHIKNGHLVKAARDFVNLAYQTTLQRAAQKFVGKIVPPDDDEQDMFWSRTDLGLAGYFSRKEPRDENDVIALFSELVARDAVEGYALFGLSQSDTYDARMIALREVDREDLLEKPTEKDLRVAEFKLLAASVVRDFERQQKDPRDVQLLIAWDEGSLPDTTVGFSFEDIVHAAAFEANPKKVYPGASRVLCDHKSGHEIQTILLKELVDSLREGAR